MSSHGESAGALKDIGEFGQILFGGSSTISGTQAGTIKGTTTQRERLKVSDEAIQKIIEDVLGGTEGLASIFAGEQTAGIFSSSVAAQAAGDLSAKLAGEIAKLTAERETVAEIDKVTTGTTKQKQEQEGLVETVLGVIGL